eukprot:1136165-Rhodomonas_salina.2
MTHPEIKYKQPLFQYSLCQECGFLCLISGCSLRALSRTPQCRGHQHVRRRRSDIMIRCADEPHGGLRSRS